MKAQALAKSFVVPLHIFPFDVFVSIGQTDEQFRQKIKRYSFSDLKDEVDGFVNLPTNCEGRTATLSNGSAVLRLINIPKTPHDFGTVTHEIFHVVDGILKRAGVELSDTSDEVYAYLAGYLTTQIYKKLTA